MLIIKSRSPYVEQVGISIDRVQSQYGYSLDDNGEMVFGVVGSTDTYAEILRHKDDTDYTILQKFLLDNPSSKDVGFYGVRVNPVGDVNDLNELVVSLNNMYNNLPADIKKKYKNFSEVISGFSKEDLQIFETNLNDNANSSEVS